MVDELKKIKDLVEIVVSKVRSMETHQSVAAEQVRMMRDQQSVMNGKLDTIDEKLGNVEEKLVGVEERLDTHTASLVKIEDTLEGYADMYKVNKEKNDELEERVEAIEDKLAIGNKN